jgi:hypothetical protein
MGLEGVADMNTGVMAIVSCYLSLRVGCKICSSNAFPAATCANVEITPKCYLSGSPYHWEHVLV